MLISIFFIAYLVMETPSNLILTRVRPSWYVPILMCLWGTCTAAMSQVDGYAHILVARFFLGAIEAGFLPGVMFIMSAWFKRAEIGMSNYLIVLLCCCAVLVQKDDKCH
jgi:MFS family permease